MGGKEYTQTKNLKNKLLDVEFNRSEFSVQTEVDYETGDIGDAEAVFKHGAGKKAIKLISKMAKKNINIIVMIDNYGVHVVSVTSKYVKNKKPIEVYDHLNTSKGFPHIERMNPKEFRKYVERVTEKNYAPSITEQMGLFKR